MRVPIEGEHVEYGVQYVFDTDEHPFKEGVWQEPINCGEGADALFDACKHVTQSNGMGIPLSHMRIVSRIVTEWGVAV